jgi:hypothetical protein
MRSIEARISVQSNSRLSFGQNPSVNGKSPDCLDKRRIVADAET